MNSTSSSVILSPWHRHDIPPPLTNIEHWLQTSPLGTRYLLSLITLELLDHPRSSWRSTFVLEIIAQAGTYSFTLQLPDSMHFIHPVFHLSMLESLTPNTFSSRKPTLDPPVMLDGELEYEISEILDSKIDKCHKCKLQYFVCWAGYKGMASGFRTRACLRGHF